MTDDDDVLDAVFDLRKRLVEIEEHQMEIIRRLLSIEDKVTKNG